MHTASARFPSWAVFGAVFGELVGEGSAGGRRCGVACQLSNRRCPGRLSPAGPRRMAWLVL
jgi:hypothetical protein